MDSETKQILSDVEKLKRLTEHEGWSVARELLVNKINDLQFIQSIDLTSPEKAIIDIQSKKLAVQILFDWLKNDIEGTVEQERSITQLSLSQTKSYIVQ